MSELTIGAMTLMCLRSRQKRLSHHSTSTTTRR